MQNLKTIAKEYWTSQYVDEHVVNMFEKPDAGKINQVIDRVHRIGILINKQKKTMQKYYY